MSGALLQSPDAGVSALGLHGTVAVAENLPATSRARLLRLDFSGRPVRFRAGHAMIVGLHGGLHRRPYSIASSPEQAAETGCLDLLIGGDAAGGSGPPLLGAAPGTLVDIEGPIGSCVCADAPPEARWLLVAGGVGVAPVRAIVDHLLRRRGPPHVTLLHSARVADEFAFTDEFRAHAAAGRLELRYAITRAPPPGWDGHSGRFGLPQLAAVLHDPATTRCLVCGPAGLVRDSVAALTELGVPEQLIRMS